MSKNISTEYVFVESITLKAKNKLDGYRFNEVEVGKCGTSNHNIIFTSGIGPCQGVIAKLNDGNFVIYHASNPSSKAQGFHDFVALIRDKVVEIFLFQKSARIPHTVKAPILAVELSIALGKSVQRIEVTKYYAIVCDAKKNRVSIISPGGFYVRNSTEDQVQIIKEIGVTSLKDCISSAIPYEKSKQEVIDYYSDRSNLYAEALLIIALSDNDHILAEKVRNQLSLIYRNTWLKESQHNSNKQLINNFYQLGLHKNQVSTDEKKFEIKKTCPSSRLEPGEDYIPFRGCFALLCQSIFSSARLFSIPDKQPVTSPIKKLSPGGI